MTVRQAVDQAIDRIIDGEGLSGYTTAQIEQMAAWAYHNAPNCWIADSLDSERATRKGHR